MIVTDSLHKSEEKGLALSANQLTVNNIIHQTKFEGCFLREKCFKGLSGVWIANSQKKFHKTDIFFLTF